MRNGRENSRGEEDENSRNIRREKSRGLEEGRKREEEGEANIWEAAAQRTEQDITQDLDNAAMR